MNNNNQHKVAFYFVLVILLATSQQCYSSKSTDIISHSSTQNLPKNANEMRQSGVDTSISEKLIQIRHLVKSLLFDWSLGESEIEGRTFGRIRMMKQLLVPAAFIGGFLTALIIGIKIIGVMNMILISGVLMLNVAFVLGKILYGKALSHEKVQHHHHDHYNPHYHSPSYGHSGSSAYASVFSERADSSLPYRNLNQPAFPQNFNQIPNNFNQPSIPQQQQFPTAAQQQPQYVQPPTNFQPQQPQMNFIQPQQPQMNFIQPQNSNPFVGMQMQIPQQQQQQPQQQQQVPTASSLPLSSNQFGQPFNQAQQQQQQVPTASSLPLSSNQFGQPLNQAPQQQQLSDRFNSQQSAIRMMNNNNGLQQISSSPSTEFEMINLQELEPQVSVSMSPLDILNDALARMEQKNSLPQLARFKRKSSNSQRRYLNLLKPFN